MNDKLISWDDFSPTIYDYKYEPTNIACPECGQPLHKYIGAVLTTYPPMYKYECRECGWYGYK